MAYKLTYFDSTGVAEPIRYLFSYGGIKFEDVRIKRDDWPALKPSTPFGQLPILEKDGKVVDQSGAIARYVAKLVKLVGKDNWEDLEIDAVIDTIGDFKTKLYEWFFETDPKIKQSKNETFFNETIPFIFSRLDAVAAKNNGYLAVGKLTWADLFMVATFDVIKEDIICGYPNLVKVRNNVLANQNINKWIETRPKTEQVSLSLTM